MIAGMGIKRMYCDIFNDPDYIDPPVEDPVEVLSRARCIVSALYAAGTGP